MYSNTSYLVDVVTFFVAIFYNNLIRKNKITYIIKEQQYKKTISDQK